MKGYFNELTRTMEYLSTKSDTIFLSQSSLYEGTGIYNTVKNIDESKRIEMPIVENLQLAISTGLSLNGFVPITCYPRINFLILAADQLINHANNLERMSSKNGWRPHLLIRVGIGTDYPINPSYQHLGCWINEIESICDQIKVWRLQKTEDIFPAYCSAYLNKKVNLLFEYQELYPD